MEKLTNAPYSTISALEPKPAAVLAVLDQRLYLTYDRRRPSACVIEGAQVSKHMRLIHVAPAHDGFVYSGYFSEPFLAEAGAHALSAWRKDYNKVAVETLAHGMEAVLSTQDDAGELVGRLILMLAYDHAVESFTKPVANPQPHPPHFSEGVDVEAFLRSLISKEHVENVLSSKPIDLPSSSGSASDLDLPLRKAFSNASVRFTHFIQTTDDVHVDLARTALCRSAAIICKHIQEAVDLVIPVVLNRNSRMVKEEITAIFIKCKLQAGCSSPTLDIDLDSIRFFGPGRVPYIVVTMDLGKDHEEVEYSPARPIWSTKEAPNTLDDTHPRYPIAIRGCSNRVYAVIDSGEEALYKKLLGNGMLSEQPSTRKGES